MPMTSSDYSQAEIAAAIRGIRNIVGAHYDKVRRGSPERFREENILEISAIPSCHGKAGHLAISIRGTQPIGLIILDECYRPTEAIDCNSGRRLCKTSKEKLKFLVYVVTGMATGQFPHDYHRVCTARSVDS